jgi:hypothetical protein
MSDDHKPDEDREETAEPEGDGPDSGPPVAEGAPTPNGGEAGAEPPATPPSDGDAPKAGGDGGSGGSDDDGGGSSGDGSGGDGGSGGGDDDGGGDKDWDDLSQPAGGHREPAQVGAAWGRPFARVDAVWVRFEARLCAVVLILEILALSLWVGLKGLSDPADSGSNAGIVFRALTGALVLGMAAYFGLHKQRMPVRRVASVAGVAIGLYIAKFWTNLGVEWASNLLNWYQQASSLTLFGGLRGVGTRLTLLLALLGGSLATASGKHITIDVITRFLRPKARLPIVVFGWVVSSVICFTAAWGFFDHISIENFEAKAEATASEKFGKVGEGIGENFFIARKQLLLDFKTLPHVLNGEPYYDWLSGKEWNAWVDEQGFAERYGKEKMAPLKIPEDAKRSPIIVVPEKGEPRGELINAFNLVVPFGLLIIAIRFLLLCILAISGHMVVDPEAHIEGSDIKKKPKVDEDVLGGQI